MHELCYTSAPKGIRPGSSGYTTVAHTKDVPATLLQRLEGLSTFDHVDKNAAAFANNPVNHAHVTFGSGQQRLHVVSRIAACPPDHSGRTNYLAHHVVVSEPETRGLAAGPAAFAAANGLYLTAWSGEPRLLPPRQPPVPADRGRADGAAWSAAGLDPKWPEYLADRLQQRGKPVYVVYPARSDAIALVADVVAAVPADQRWGVTFATHATTGFPGLGVDCQLRFVVAGTPYAAEVKAKYKLDCIDLTTRAAAPSVAKRATADLGPVVPVDRSAGPQVGPVRSPAGIGRQGNGLDAPVRAPGGDDSEKGAFRSTKTGISAVAVTSNPGGRGRSVWTWVFAGTTLLASLAAFALLFAWRQQAEVALKLQADLNERDEQIERKDEQIRQLTREARPSVAGPGRGDRDAGRPASGNMGPAIGDLEADGEGSNRPSQNQDEASNPGNPMPAATASGDEPQERQEPKTTTAGRGDSPPQQSSYKFADVADIRAKADKAKGKEWQVTLVSGLGKKDEVTVGLAGGGEVLGCELTGKRKNNWELKQTFGDEKQIARCQRSGDKLELIVQGGPNSELLRYLTIEVGVTSPGGVTADRHPFAWGDPRLSRFNLTPVKTPADPDPFVKDCGEDFKLFADPEACQRLSAILAAVPDLELSLDFGDSGRLAAEGGPNAITIKRLQSHDGTQWKLNERQVCGLVLKLPEPGEKVIQTPPFRLTHYWIQNPSTNAGLPSLDRGVQIHMSMDGNKIDDGLNQKIREARKRANELQAAYDQAPPDKKEQAAKLRQKAHEDLVAEEEALRQIKQGFDESKQRLRQMPLKDFQDVPVRVTLRRPSVDDEIVVIDYLGK